MNSMQLQTVLVVCLTLCMCKCENCTTVLLCVVVLLLPPACCGGAGEGSGGREGQGSEGCPGQRLLHRVSTLDTCSEQHTHNSLVPGSPPSPCDNLDL